MPVQAMSDGRALSATMKMFVTRKSQTIRKKASLVKPATDGVPSFLAIQIQQSSMVTESSKPIMELVFNNGARLNFYHTVSADYYNNY